MQWRRRDMGSDPVHPVYVTTDIPTVDNDQYVEVHIPVSAYKRLVNWCSMGRTMDNVTGCLADGSPDEERTRMVYQEMSDLREALQAVHDAIRQHYIQLPHKVG